MAKAAPVKVMTKLPKVKYPWCLRCNRRVETLTIQPKAARGGIIIVEYQCHGERVSQEMATAQLTAAKGLADYTAFNTYTSGLMLHAAPDKVK